MFVLPLRTSALFPSDPAEGLVGSRSSNAIAVAEVAAEQRDTVSAVRIPLGSKMAFRGALVGCGAISGWVIIWLVRQVLPASRL
jgi:hypothetical protein